MTRLTKMNIKRFSGLSVVLSEQRLISLFNVRLFLERAFFFDGPGVGTTFKVVEDGYF